MQGLCQQCCGANGGNTTDLLVEHLEEDHGALHAVLAIRIDLRRLLPASELGYFRLHEIGRPLVHLLDDELEVILD